MKKSMNSQSGRRAGRATDRRRSRARGGWTVVGVLMIWGLLGGLGFARGADLAAANTWAGADPSAEPLDVEVLSVRTNEGVRIESLYFTSHRIDGEPVRVFAYYACPDPATSAVPGILYLHGGGQAASEREVVALAQDGYAALSPDWKVPREPNQTNYPSRWPFDAQKQRKRAPLPFDSTAWLGRRGLTFLEQRPEVDGARLGVYGFSWGGFFTWLVAGLDSRVKAAVPMCGGAGRGVSIPLVHAWNHPETFVRNISCPLLLLNGANDFFGQMDLLQDLMSAVPTETRRVIAANENHAFTGFDGPVLRNRWFDRYLRNGPPFPPEPGVTAKADGERVRATARAPGATVCRLLFSRGTNSVVERCWFGRDMEPDGDGAFTTVIPGEPSLDLWYYVTADYADGISLSSRYEVRAADASAAEHPRTPLDVLYDPATDGAFPWYRSWRGRPPEAGLAVSVFDGESALHAVAVATNVPPPAGAFGAFLRTPACPLRRSRGATALRLRLDATRPATVRILAYDAGTFFGTPLEASRALPGETGWATVDIPASAFKGPEAGTNAPPSTFDAVLQFYVQIDSAGKPDHGPRIGRLEWIGPEQ